MSEYDMQQCAREGLLETCYVITEAQKSERLKSETLGREGRCAAIVNTSTHKENSENHPSLTTQKQSFVTL